jgi:hypothetical protein
VVYEEYVKEAAGPRWRGRAGELLASERRFVLVSQTDGQTERNAKDRERIVVQFTTYSYALQYSTVVARSS